jgi:hypothetical protein
VVLRSAAWFSQRSAERITSRGAETALVQANVAYRHLPEPGGRRASAPDSANDGWRVAGFRGYADHLRSEDLARGRAAPRWRPWPASTARRSCARRRSGGAATAA